MSCVRPIQYSTFASTPIHLNMVNEMCTEMTGQLQHTTQIYTPKAKVQHMPLSRISQITSSPSIWLLFVHGCYEKAS